MTLQHIPARSQIEAFRGAVAAESRAFLVVREGDADAAHEGGGDVVQNGGQHGQGRQQYNVDHGDDGGKGCHLAEDEK